MTTSDDQFFQQLFYFIWEVHQLAMKQPDNPASFRGQGRIIHLLAHHGGLSQREIANLAKVKPGSVSEVLERLAKNKMITRWRDRNDRRIVRVKLADKGEQLYHELAEKRRQFEREMLQNVTKKEKQTFLTVITKMQEQLNCNYGDLLPKGRKGCGTDD